MIELSSKEARTVKKFRKSPYATVLKGMLNRELAEKRHEFESTLAEEGKRGYVQAIKAIEDVLFHKQIEVEDGKPDD